MAFLNFLTQGQPLPSTSSTLSTSQVPQYLSDYLYNLMSGAYSAAQQPYQTYSPSLADVPKDVQAKGEAATQEYMARPEIQARYQRIAGFTPEQFNAIQMTTGQRPSTAPAAWSPYQDEIHTMVNTMGVPGADMRAPLDPSDTGDVSTTVMPYPSQPAGGAATAYRPQLTAAEQTAAKGAGLDTLKSADPYFRQASKNVPGVISDYMNPYNEQVIEAMGDQAKRLLQEKILPTIGDQFTRAGQYGSSRQQEIAQRGVRDVASDLEANIGKQLAQGYTTAGQQAQTDLQRQAQLGQAAGQLAGTQETNLTNLANVQAGLGQKAQALGLTGAAAMEATGAEQQAMNQRNLDLAYQDFQTQTQYPEQQLGFLSNIVRGLPSGGGTTSGTTSSLGQSYSASPLASLASAGLSAAALSNLLGKS